MVRTLATQAPMLSPSLALDDQICFALYSASRALTARYRELLEPLGVTYPQYLVLLTLWESDALDHTHPTVSQLCARLQLDSGTISPLLRRLEVAGRIRRSRSSADERSVQVELTDSGRALKTLANSIPERLCASTGLGLDELAELRAQIAALAQHVRASE